MHMTIFRNLVCIYQFHCYYCNSGQAITCECMYCKEAYIDHFTSLVSVEPIVNAEYFYIGRPTTDKAWLCSAWVVMAMPLQLSARA